MNQTSASDGTKSTGRFPRLDYGQMLILLIVFVMLYASSVFRESSPIKDRRFIGTDTYARMVRVQDLVETGDWFDATYRRVNPPLGHLSHWSRPMDAAILAGAKLLSTVFDLPDSLYWAGAAISPLFHLLTLLVLVLGTRPLFGKNWAMFCGLLFLVQPTLLQSFAAGRPDHHGLQILLTALIIVATPYLLLRPFKRSLCYATGALFALGLWTGIETVLPITGVIGGLTLCWVIWRRDFARKSLHLSLSAVVGTLVALFLERGPQGFMDMALEADRLSWLHVVLFALPWGIWATLYLWDRTRTGETGVAARMAAVTACGIVALGLLWLVQPDLFAGRVAVVDPLYAMTRSSHILESQPVYRPGSLEAFGPWFVVQRIAVYFGYALAGAIFLIYLLAHPRTSRRELWIFIASALGAVMIFVLTKQGLALRDGPLLGLILLFPYTELVIRIHDRLSGYAWHGAALLRTFSLAALVMWPYIIAWAAGSTEPNLKTRGVTKVCPVTEMARYLGGTEPWRDPPRWIMALADFGPEIMYRTRHSVFSIPNHRLQTGYTDTYRAMSATRDEAARAIIERREVDLILLCRSPMMDSFYRRGAQVSSPEETIFRERLLRGQVPTWLKPVPLPDRLNDGFLLLEVDLAVADSS